MITSPFDVRQALFVRRDTCRPWEDLKRARIVRRDLFIKTLDDREVPFIVVTLELKSCRIIRAVEDVDCLPFLDEINDALEKIHASAH
jgi:hypothetical protein